MGRDIRKTIIKAMLEKPKRKELPIRHNVQPRDDVTQKLARMTGGTAVLGSGLATWASDRPDINKSRRRK